MFCNNCGKEVAKTAKFCGNCGSAVAGGAYTPPAPTHSPAPLSDRKLRHGFTSFWLWSTLIVYCLGTIGFIILWVLGDLDYMSTIGRWGTLIISWIAIYGLFSILDWSRGGFYGFAFSCVASIFYNLFFMPFDDLFTPISLISTAASLLITYGVLHIRNAYNALSTWEQMDEL